jgi:hypothetical protein
MRRSDAPVFRSTIPRAPRVPPTSPVDGEAVKTRLLQVFPDGKPPYLEADGPLDTPCWLWLGSTHLKGYALRWVDNKRLTVHRELVGPLTDAEEAHHLCEVRRCVNPAHVQRVTKAEHARIHRGGRTALEDALELLARYSRLSPAAIADLSGQPRSAVSSALGRATRSGHVRRVGVGEYVLSEVSA